MRSNDVAKLAGVTVRTLRHYHQLGLLSEPPRRANGYRDYSPADVARVLRIKRLAALGFPLSRIGDVLEEMDAEEHATSASALDELDRERFLDEIAFAGYNEAQQDVYDRIERGIEEIMTERAQRENATAASPQVVHEPFDSDATS